MIEQAGTLAWFAKIYFLKGIDEAKKALISEVPEILGSNFFIIKNGHSVQRVDVIDSDFIKYTGFNPPPSWESPYSILFAEFEKSLKDEFIYHSGEEILIPTFGSVNYRFLKWNFGEELPKEYFITKPISCNEVIRINPRIPHHTWADSDEGARAWMILRHISDTTNSISLDSALQKPKSARRYSLQKEKEKYLINSRNYASYALIAFGISEKITLHRERANLTTEQLSNLCNIKSSHVSRIENAEANVSIQKLIKICDVLKIDLWKLLTNKLWTHESVELLNVELLNKPVDMDHLIHINSIICDKNEEYNIDSNLNIYNDVLSSYIVKSGSVVVEILDKNDEHLAKELIESGGVLHLRNNAYISKVYPQEKSQIIRVIYSMNCLC